jgi:hypothetical protein
MTDMLKIITKITSEKILQWKEKTADKEDQSFNLPVEVMQMILKCIQGSIFGFKNSSKKLDSCENGVVS